MKWILPAFFVAVSCHAGVLLDKDGKVSSDGKPVFQWFAEVLTSFDPLASRPGDLVYKDADIKNFEKKNHPLIAWEIEKLMKRRIFAANIPFPGIGRSYNFPLIMSSIYPYLKYTPDSAAALEKLLYIEAGQRNLMSHGRGYQPYPELEALTSISNKDGVYYKRLKGMLKDKKGTTQTGSSSASRPPPIRFPKNMPAHIREQYAKRVQQARSRMLRKRSGSQKTSQKVIQSPKQYSTLADLLTDWLNARTYSKESYCASADKRVEKEKDQALDTICTFVLRPKSDRIWEWAFIQFDRFGEKSIPSLKKILENSDVKGLHDRAYGCLDRICKRVGQQPLQPIYGQLLKGLKDNRYWPYDKYPFKLILNAVPADLIVNYILENKLPIKGNEFSFAKVLRNLKEFPKPVVTLMSEILRDSKDFPKEEEMLQLVVSKKLNPAGFEPILLEIMKRRISNKQTFVAYYYRFSKNFDRCIKLIKKNYLYSNLEPFYLAYAENVKDYNRVVSLQDELIRSIPKESIYSHYDKARLRGELFPLLRNKSGLSNDSQVEILKSYFKSPYTISDKDFKINPQYYQALLKLYKDPEFAGGSPRFFLLLCRYTDSGKWPDDLVNIFIDNYKKFWITRHGQLQDEEKKIVYGVTGREARKKLVEDCLKIFSSVSDPSLGLFAERELLRNADIALEPLKRLVNSDDSYLAVKACNLIGKMSIYGQPAIPELEKAAQSPDWTIQVCAINALARIGARKESTKKLLINALNGKNKGVSQAAAEALVLLGDSYDQNVVDKIIRSEYYKNSRMGRMSERWIKDLLQELVAP